MYIYYIDNRKNLEKSIIADDKKSVYEIINYYKKRELQQDAVMSDVSFYIAPINTKARILDTIDNQILKIEYIYLNIDGIDRLENRKGYIPIFFIHSNPAITNRIYNRLMVLNMTK
jgi:hypothetical protein